MLNERLNKSPLTYVLVQVKISQILKMKDSVPDLQEAIREEFPLYNEFNIPLVEVKQTIDGLKPEFRTVTQWHFVDKTSTMGVFADIDSIVFHTTKYESFEHLSCKLKNVMEKFNKLLKISLYSRLGIRYVNLIKSTKLVKPELQGFIIGSHDGFKESEYINRTETIQKTEESIVRIQSTRMSKSDKDLPLFVLPDLKQSASYLSFNHYNKPSNNYLILDIDCFSEKQGDFEVETILKNFERLHDKAYIAFKYAITEEALIKWR